MNVQERNALVCGIARRILGEQAMGRSVGRERLIWAASTLAATSPVREPAQPVAQPAPRRHSQEQA